MTDLFVSEKEFIALKEAVTDYGAVVENVIDQFLEVLARAGKNGIKGGQVAEKLFYYRALMKDTKGSVSTVTRKLSDDIQDFLDKIDRVDQYLE
jgi:hypothetical protein